MITFAKPDMIKDLKELWSEGFGDEESYIDFYFEHRFRCEEALVWMEGEKPVGMLSLLPANVFLEGSFRPIRYVFAVATRKAWRGKGISSALLKDAEEYLKQKGEGCILHPAGESLFRFYGSKGYTTNFSIKEVTFEFTTPKEKQSDGLLACLPLDPADYTLMRDKYFINEGYVCWDEHAVEYALKELLECGGFVYRLIYENKNTPHLQIGGVMGYIDENGIYIKEITMESGYLEDIARLLAEKFSEKKVTIRLPFDADLKGVVQDFGMSTFPAGHSGYLGLALD